MSKIITLYHGSTEKIKHPALGKGKRNNDYGQGFYCTAHRDLACEWASKLQGLDGYVNQYEIDTAGLKVLDLSKYGILHWMTILLKNRTFTLTTPISIQGKAYLMEHFDIDISSHDIIKGYRADDSYFSFAEDFLNNAISVSHLSRATRLGKLGIQYVLVSQKAFDALRFVQADPVENSVYYPLHMVRDTKARKAYRSSKANLTIDTNDIYLLDILRGGIEDGDPRLSR